jgi:phosphate:Na+ symporter
MMALFSTALGGLGLFLLGMWLITEGLRVAAGTSLSRLLSSWTRSRRRGLFAGAFLTALVQSSSAVTVAALGFVNTGLLRFERAVWVIFGSNVGTTLTAWLVALVGFKFQVDVLALPLIGVGAGLRVFAPVDRYRNLGMALAGFGILFLGIETLAGGFDALGSKVTLAETGQPIWLMVGIGIVLTTLMQSSSASMAIVLTALAGGLLDFQGAAGAVIGANIGTTSTAILATLGATANARRLASAHVLFNLLTGVVALVLLVPLTHLVFWLAGHLHLADDPTSTLALFHTTFNALGILLMWPLEPPMSRFLLRRFQQRQRSVGALQFLDRNVVSLPEAGSVALFRELERLMLLYPPAVQELPEYRQAHAQAAGQRRLVLEGIGDYLADASRSSLTEVQADMFSHGWRIQHNLSNMEDALQTLDRNGLELARQPDQDQVVPVLKGWFARVRDRMADDMSDAGNSESFDAYRQDYDLAKQEILRTGVSGKLGRHSLEVALQDLSLSRRLVEQWHHALSHLRVLKQMTQVPEEGPPAPAEATPAPAEATHQDSTNDTRDADASR